jgi:K+-sensing histidine kinase KdpD
MIRLRPQVARAGRQAVTTLAVAAVLVAAATLTRAALHPYLGTTSPFMLYVGAVLVAGLVRGPACGAIVMMAGGLAGLRLFLSPDGVSVAGAGLAMIVFWSISIPVLFTASELRAQLGGALDRLSAAARRGGRVA